ncbi:hypothetical protein ACDL92_07825 [Ihubacter sp. mB4P-1]|uniref:hypothetical protein n=1 Tax=Ihubacter sp. mB4P-1 TaxID=3242370 RepID=UPI00137A210A
MKKEEMLKAAFEHALNNPALNFADDDVDALVMTQAMTEFAAKNNYDLTKEEITEYVGKQIKNMDETVKDFSYQNKMMN